MEAHTYMFFWQTQQTQSVVLFPNSLHPLQTLSLQALHKAPLFMILPSSALHRAQHLPSVPSASAAVFKAPLRRSACNSVFNFLFEDKKIKTFKFLPSPLRKKKKKQWEGENVRKDPPHTRAHFIPLTLKTLNANRIEPTFAAFPTSSG